MCDMKKHLLLCSYQVSLSNEVWPQCCIWWGDVGVIILCFKEQKRSFHIFLLKFADFFVQMHRVPYNVFWNQGENIKHYKVIIFWLKLIFTFLICKLKSLKSVQVTNTYFYNLFNR